MIFTGFKRKSNQIFFNKRLPNLLENLNQNSSGKVKKVLIFLNENSDKKGIKNDLVEIFKIPESSIRAIVFQQKIKKGQVLDDVITPKDFGWYGKINSEELKSILTKKYDLLISYRKVDNLYCNLLLLQCKAGFRVGFAHLDSRFYDLIINCKLTDKELFHKELKKYLGILNKV